MRSTRRRTIRSTRGSYDGSSPSGDEPVVYLELAGAQHAFDVLPSIRTRLVVRAVDRYLGALWVAHRQASDAPCSPAITSSDSSEKRVICRQEPKTSTMLGNTR